MDETKDSRTDENGVTPLSALGPLTPISAVQPKDDGRMMTSLLRSALYNMQVQDGDRFLRAQEAIVEKAVNMALGGSVPMIELIWAYSDGKPLQKVLGNVEVRHITSILDTIENDGIIDI